MKLLFEKSQRKIKVDFLKDLQSSYQVHKLRKKRERPTSIHQFCKNTVARTHENTKSKKNPNGKFSSRDHVLSFGTGMKINSAAKLQGWPKKNCTLRQSAITFFCIEITI